MDGLNHRLEIYKVFVTTITANENRRQRASTIYLAMLAAIATVASSIRDMDLIYPVMVILLISIIWLCNIIYFLKLAQAKFLVVAEIEKNLPIAAFGMEWQTFKDNKRWWQISLTKLEMTVPVLAIVLCISYVAFYFFSLT